MVLARFAGSRVTGRPDVNFAFSDIREGLEARTLNFHHRRKSGDISRLRTRK